MTSARCCVFGCLFAALEPHCVCLLCVFYSWNRLTIAIDLETRDDGINEKLGAGWAIGKGEIVGFAVAVDGWQGYFPFGHLGGGNMIPEQVKDYMKKICSLPCPKIFHNAQYDVGWLEASGIKVHGPIIDTMIAAALIDENRFSYSLNTLSVDYLGEIKAETELREAAAAHGIDPCLLYTSPSPRDRQKSRMPSSA